MAAVLLAEMKVQLLNMMNDVSDFPNNQEISF
jgi:hypothetical protein